MASWRTVNRTPGAANVEILPPNPARTKLILTFNLGAGQVNVRFGQQAVTGNDGMLVAGPSHPGLYFSVANGDEFIRSSVNVFGTAAGEFVAATEVVGP